MYRLFIMIVLVVVLEIDKWSINVIIVSGRY